MRRHTLLAVAFALLTSGCVSKGTYDAAVQSANQARAEERTQVAALQEQIASLHGRIDQLQQQLDAANSKLADQAAAAQADLSRVRREQAATEARVALFHDLARKLAKMVDAGDLRIVLRDGRMVLQLPNDVLFDTARTDIKRAGRDALEKIASVLRTVHGHDFQVAGNTDNVPIETPQFPSNWELSSARALVVVHFLVGHGMDPTTLSAAGYGEFDPVASNDSAAGRAKNRRTEITVQPNIDEFVAVPESP
jgi:chemotaxis protein MotB